MNAPTILFDVGPVDLHWRVYVSGVCIGEVRKMYGANGPGNDGFRYDFFGHRGPGGHEDELSVAIGRVLIGCGCDTGAHD